MAALLAAAWCAPIAMAQTQNISNFSGNGQLICPTCPLTGQQNFDQLVVKVTDASGNVVSGALVNWNIVSGNGVIGDPTQSYPSSTSFSDYTDATGLARAVYYPTTFNFASSAQPYIQSQITASTASGSTVNLFETITAIPSSTSVVQTSSLVQTEYLTPGNSNCANCADPNDVTNVVTGVSGATSSQQIGWVVYAPNSSEPSVPNVEIHLISNQTSPGVACGTAAGADPGTVLTDQTGTAYCAIVLSGSGTGTFFSSVGGVSPNPNGYIGYQASGNINVKVTPGSPASVTASSGNAQSANPGQLLPLALVALVRDQNGNPLSGQQVSWSVSPTGAATLTNTSTTSDANGQVKTNVTFTNTAVGAVTITASLTSNNKLLATFTETANVQVTGLSIVSGNNQSAIVSSSFASPLIVQLTTSNGTPTANVPVQFTLTGPGALSAASAITNANGQAQVSVSAGSVTGSITVTASAGNFSQTFTLTVIPAGPTMTANSFYNGADFQRGSISPCSIATIIAPGIAPTIQGAIEGSMLGPLPYTLGSDTVTINGAQAPIFNIANTNNQQQITFQVPCSLTPGSATVTVNVGGGTASVAVPLNPASPGIFGVQQSNGSFLPVLERPDGSFVSAQNPARAGETVIAFVTGLGPTTPAVATNSLPIPGSAATVQGTVIVGFAGGGIPFTSAQASPDLIGVYEVSFQVPSTGPTGNQSFSIGLLPAGSSTVYYSALGTFPVQ